jgi:chromosome segregation ATPase
MARLSPSDEWNKTQALDDAAGRLIGSTRLAVIDAQLEDVRRRLHKLYDALETGKLEVEDLAPRIKELNAQKDDLEENALT